MKYLLLKYKYFLSFSMRKVTNNPIKQIKKSGKNGPVNNAIGNKYNIQEEIIIILLFIN